MTRTGILSIPGALLEELRYCIYDVRDLFTINIIKCKLLTSRKTARSKSAFMKNEVVPFSQRFDFGISCKSQLAICFSVLCV